MPKINLTNTNYDKQNTMKLNEIQEMILLLKGALPTEPTISNLLSNVQAFFTTAINTLSARIIDPNVDPTVDYATLEQRLNGLLDELSEEHSSIMGQITNSTSDLSTTLATMQDGIITAFGQIDLTSISSALSTIDSAIDDISTAISTMDTTINGISSTVSEVSTTVSAINSAVASLQTAVSSVATDVQSLDNTAMTSQLTEISDQLDDVLTAVNNLGTGSGGTPTEPPYDPAPTTTYSMQTTYLQHYPLRLGTGTLTSYKEYFTCNDNQNLLIKINFLFTTTATMPNSFIKVYLNGTLIHTEPYDIVPVTSAPICFYAMTTATRTDHEIYVVIEATAPQAMTMYELTYTIQGKNVNFLFSYPTYQIASNNSNYRIIKRVGKVYSYLDTLQTPLDLSGGYTALTTKTYFESPLYLNTVGTYPGPSYNRNFFYFQHDHYTGKGLLQNANFETQGTFSGYYPCDPVCLTNFELSVYIGVATSDTTFKIIRHRTDTYAVNDYIPTQTMETKIINITMVKNHWSKYSSAKQPIPLIQLRNGRNYAYIPSISTLLYLGYGTKISGGFSNNQNIDFKVYLKQYDHWVCEEITVTDTTASVTNTTTIEANYDEMHPGIDNEVFIVSNGVFTKLS